MKIVVNTRLLLKNRLEGIGWFIHECFRRIVIDHPEHHFYFLFDRDFDTDFIFAKNVTPIIIHPQTRHPILQYIWFEYSIPKILKKINPDIFVSPDGYLSLKSNCKQLCIIHDLNFEHFSIMMPYLVQKYYQYFFPRFAKKADRIATVSAFSKKDIIETYSIEENKIDVVYNAAKDGFDPIKEEEIKAVRNSYTNGKPYFIFVGSLQDRKNLKNLFLAFDFLKQENKSESKLMIVGEKKWWSNDLKTIFKNMQFKSDVIFTGRVSQEELYKLIPSALALSYTSLFEGFGVPILEGFSSGVPVITSNCSSMPEVAGDAALLIDPFSVISIANALNNIEKDPILRKNLIQKGNKRKLVYSWQQTADKLWSSIEKTINQL